jgi:hypothetical protein
MLAEARKVTKGTAIADKERHFDELGGRSISWRRENDFDILS